MNFQQGAFGPVTELATLVRFWSIMELLHYPMAAQIKQDLQQELEQKREQQMRQTQIAAMQNAQPIGVPAAANMMEEAGTYEV